LEEGADREKTLTMKILIENRPEMMDSSENVIGAHRFSNLFARQIKNGKIQA
jgi:hypothetical protein